MAAFTVVLLDRDNEAVYVKAFDTFEEMAERTPREDDEVGYPAWFDELMIAGDNHPKQAELRVVDVGEMTKQAWRDAGYDV
jgi:hypothetical protein